MRIPLKEIADKEDGLIFVEDVVQEIVQNAGDIIYTHHIQRRVVPYAVQRSAADILAMVEVC